jgi:hypothetical protein
MVMSRKTAEAKLSAARARLYKTAANGSRYVFYVPSRGIYVAIDGIGNDQVRWSEHASCPACR